MSRILFYSIIIFYCLHFLSGLQAKSSADYLIIKNPFELKIYNKYEQNLSPKDSSCFLPFCPIEIIADDTLLSDNYTAAFIGKIENQTFYFIKPQENMPFSKLYDSYSYFVKNAKSIADTIQIIRGDKILFYNAKDKNQQERLADSTKLVRVFKKGARSYVKTITSPVQYGWCDLRSKNYWTVYKSIKKERTDNIAEIESIIKEKLFEANDVIQKLFNHFNKLNQKNISVPYWTFSNKNNEFLCSMLNNENKYDFTESTNILIDELQLALAHSAYDVLWQSNEILIHKKQAEE